MPILGMRTTANFVANQRPENYRESIALMYPNSSRVRKAPLTALTSVMQTRSTDDPVFHWWEKALNNRRFLVTAALGVTAAGVAGTLTVDASYNAATGVKKNDILFVEATGEVMRVSADPSATNAIPVVRGVATGGSGLAMDPAVAGTNPYAMVIGSAFEEGSDAPTGVNYDPLERSNYTQIFRSTLEGTRTAMKTRLRTRDQVVEAKRECLEYFSIDMERAFWFSKKGSSTVNGKPWRMMGGIFQQIESVSSANIITADTATGVDMDWLEARMEEWFREGSSEKVFFAGSGALLTLGQIIRKNSSLQIQSGMKEYGMEVVKITSAFGQLTGFVHPLFSQMAGGTNGGTAFYSHRNTMAILDMDYIKYVYFTDSDIKYQPDLTPVGLDGMKSGYLGEVSIEVQFPATHFIVKNLAKPKKDA
jgi:hypothetical protein